MTHLTLTIASGPSAGRTIRVDSGDAMVVGRLIAAELGFLDVRMSRRHFQVKREKGVWHLRDLKSSNGTNVNGECLVETTLREGDMIVAGDTEFQVSIGNAAVRPDSSKSDSQPDHR